MEKAQETKLDSDIQKELDKSIKKNPERLHRFIRMHYEDTQIARNKTKEFPHAFQLLEPHIRKLEKASIPCHTHSTEEELIGGKYKKIITVGFKTKADFRKAMEHLKMISSGFNI